LEHHASSEVALRRLFDERLDLKAGVPMPGIDFATVRSKISLAQVLDLLGFILQERSGNQVRGPCPVPRSSTGRRRSFSANLAENQYRCFKCGSAGSQLELWAAVKGQSVYAAALDLCNQLGIEVPWIHRW
jgi:hypothetical protein